MLALVVLWIDAFEFGQLLQVDAYETLDMQWGPADLANFGDFAWTDLLNFINNNSSFCIHNIQLT